MKIHASSKIIWLLIVALGALHLLAGCAAHLDAGDETGDITGVAWKWESTLYNNDDKFVPPDPEKFTVTFLPDGKVEVLADCNRCNGAYTLDGGKITIEIALCTRAFCGEDSLDGKFLEDLNRGTGIGLKENGMFIELPHDTGSMLFSK